MSSGRRKSSTPSATIICRKGENKKAAQAFDEVERQHPYSEWATRAQLMAAYAHYLEYEYDDAIIALDRFVELHPGYKDVAYAYYLRGLSYYDQIVDVGRDQRNTELAHGDAPGSGRPRTRTRPMRATRR